MLMQYILWPCVHLSVCQSPASIGRQIQVEWVKIGDFRPISLYISDTMQDNYIVTMEG